MKKMTVKDAARIQSAEAQTNGGKVNSKSFVARAQAAAAKNVVSAQKPTPQTKPAPKPQPPPKLNPDYPSKTPNPSGLRRGNNPKKK